VTKAAYGKGSPGRQGILLLPLLGLLLLAACGSREQSTPTPQWPPPARTPLPPTPSVPSVDISLTAKDVSVKPPSLQAGFPFTITLVIHNRGGAPALELPVMVYISPLQETIGYSSFMEVLTVTLPSTRPLSLEVPVHWNLAGGEHRLWVQVNRLPEAWMAQSHIWPEKDTSDNSALLELMVQPFDAYRSELCPGRVDVETDAAGLIAEPGSERVRVRIHNAGNQAAYHLPVVISGDGLSGIAYTPAIPPCGGMAEVWVQVDRPLIEGETIALSINPQGWEDGLAEDDFVNNDFRAQVARTASGSTLPGPVDYDFALAAAGVVSPEQWLVLVTVHNLGTRDAADVPIHVENKAGRSVNDVIPLVQGNGTGVAAIRVGTLWKRGGTLTLTVNPAGARGALPEADHSNNATTFTLP
jgi:hypothetical protein